jgi:c-di-GMP-binding flagellar brake protein YcgR
MGYQSGYRHEPEQRKYPRVSARVIYAAMGDEYLGTAVYTKDISTGGICFITADKVFVDTLISLAVTLPGGGSFQTKGRILREEEIKVHWTPNEQYKIAVEFTHLSDDAKEKISRFIERTGAGHAL